MTVKRYSMMNFIFGLLMLLLVVLLGCLA